jgi:hypothetical protein
MNGDLLDPRLPVRLIGRDDIPDRPIKAVPERRRDGLLVVDPRDGEGYFYLPRPFDREPDGTIRACWVEDPTVSTTWTVERDSRPRLGTP